MMKKKYFNAIRLRFGLRKVPCCLVLCLLITALSCCSSIDDAVTNMPEDQSQLIKIISNKWFLPKDKKLKGFYGGALFTTGLLTSSQIGVDVADTPYFNRLDVVHGGGDFRMVLYTDGTVRTQLAVPHPGLTISFNSPFRFEGRYTLGRFGTFETTDMSLANKPKSFFSKQFTKMRLKGKFDKGSKTFTVSAESYNKKARFWRRWQVLKKEMVLQTAAKRDISASGTVKGSAIGETHMFSRKKTKKLH